MSDTATRRITPVIHARAVNDRNGNPRRCYIVIGADGYIADILNEGYEGRTVYERKYPSGEVVLTLDITPGEYRRLRKAAAVQRIAEAAAGR